ncbi:NAD(P)-dependent dehydrogenase (short-subunit alcohol dehydrogenase family) [Paraburkholderia sp. HC6.4b]|nr:NAD(P)-dependent dehydrogenase (short-subunit alcohol dehydrogenase family) [Paraburkholderia sp. HC6.4b]MBB5453913.1 NAD(P)-dependent dehydrogenase (short-subunit alcohol dehydrogenase family) [Paraburkholderia sp. Kb1A]
MRLSMQLQMPEAKPITDAGGKAVKIGGDVSKLADAQGIVDGAIEHFGRLDIVVNNAGIYELASIEDVTEEHFHEQFNINVLGTLLVTQAAIKHLLGGGSIITLSSVASHAAVPRTAVYAGTKGAIDAVTGGLSRELGPRHIRVNSIQP